MDRAVRSPKPVPPFRSIPADLAFLFDDPPLLRHEDPAKYRALVEGLGAAVGRVDAISVLWVRDVADITFEIMRLREFQTTVIEHERKAAKCKPGETDLTAIEHSLNPLERIAQMLAVAELRRNNALREIERFQSRAADRLRVASDQALALDGVVVPSKEAQPRPPIVRLVRQNRSTP